MPRVLRIQWATDVDCPRCGAKGGAPCKSASSGEIVPDHMARVHAARRAADSGKQ